MSILKIIKSDFESILNKKFKIDDFNFEKISFEITNDNSRGEVTTNIALVLSKQFNMKPIEFAKNIIEDIKNIECIGNVEIAGPGFINMNLKTRCWIDELKKVVTLGEKYGDINIVDGENVHIEFVSANPTGPMHAGHVRNAVLGDTISSILQKVGYKVYKEYYINDSGKQVEFLAKSVYLRYKEALGDVLPSNAFDGDLYPGDYLIGVGQTIANKYGNKWVDVEENDWLPVFKKVAVDEMMTLIKDDLNQLGISMDCYTSEKELTDAGKVDDVLKKLEVQDDVYTGVLNPPKGMKDEDWEERPQLLFRSTKYGDDLDRPLKKSDGSWTYFAADVAYHFDKISRGFLNMINVLGADHCGYVKRIVAATKAVSQGKANLDVKLFQIVNFFENGKPVKMSKRAGSFITSRDIVERVGKDATRFMMVSRHNSTIVDFDFEKVLEQSQENPIFYIQYAHARICSVFRNVKEIWSDIDENSIKQCNDLDSICDQEEINMIRSIASWPVVLEQAARSLEPNRITNYLYNLASDFHRLWNCGKNSPSLRFIDHDNRNITLEKLYLISGVATVIRDGLKLLGIEPLSELR